MASSFNRSVRMMAFRTSRLFKAVDKHEATTPQQVKDLLAAGDDAEMVDSATGKLTKL